MNNNTAFIAKIGNFEKIENADKIIKASVILDGASVTSVVVGINDYKENDLVVYFDSNLCLSDTAIQEIDKQASDFTKEGFNSVARYLARGNRVRCIKLRGVFSDGLVIPVDKFYIFFKNEKEAIKTLVEGFSFTLINDVEICHKYVVPVKTQSQGSGKDRKKRKLISRVIPSMFRFHVDTQQAQRNIHVFKPDQLISCSAKFHGTSSICSYTKVLKKLTWYETVLKKLGVNIVDYDYDYLYASRTVVKNDLLNGAGFYSQNIWQDAGEKYFKGKLHKGETVYFEIVGYLSNGSFIQKPFDYGCAVNEFAIRVYRITLTSEDGTVSEYSWSAMKERCNELNVDMVVEYYYGKACDMYKDIPIDDNWNINFIQRLTDVYLEKDNPWCLKKGLPDEGVVIRIEGLNINPYKLKSKRFIAKESELMEKEDYTDIEATPEDEVQKEIV